MSISSGLSGLMPESSSDLYSATADISEGTIDADSTEVTGDRDTPLFEPDNELGKNEFLNLLTTQLQYQNPLKPMKNEDFVAQLAQFSALEGNKNIESAVEDLGSKYEDSVDSQKNAADSMSKSSTVSLIGREVRLKKTNLTPPSAGSTKEITVNLGSRSSAEVEILDQEGEVVKTISTGEKGADNSAVASWDGTNGKGEAVEPGYYEIRIPGEENNPSLYAFVEDTVTGVNFNGDEPKLKIAGTELPAKDIVDVSVGKGTEESSSSYSGATGASDLYALLGMNARVRETNPSYTPSMSGETVLNIDTGGYDKVELETVDPEGEVVNKQIVEAGTGGVATVSIPKKDYNGSSSYSFRLPSNQNGYFFEEGSIEGINRSGTEPMLYMNGKTFSPSEIIAVRV